MRMLTILLLLTTSALAQQPSQYTLTVTDAQLNLIGAALGKQPYENVYQLIAIISQQVAAQQKTAPAVSAAPQSEQPK